MLQNLSILTEESMGCCVFFPLHKCETSMTKIQITETKTIVWSSSRNRMKKALDHQVHHKCKVFLFLVNINRREKKLQEINLCLVLNSTFFK